jgi:hypothetical protein
MDEDLETRTREELVAEVKRLRRGIREHRDSAGQDLCWHHPALWGLLPEKTDPVPAVPDWPEFMRGCVNDPVPPVPDWPEFMRGCVKYRQSLDRHPPKAP